jgi:hypothetical protein
MNAVIEATATIENIVDLEDDQQHPEPIRVIRKVNGVYRWLDILPSELSDDECRAIYVAAFNIY